jgi:hypothetical protein
MHPLFDEVGAFFLPENLVSVAPVTLPAGRIRPSGGISEIVKECA